jgi:adenosylmethionine-8-amino-7-oxononanoate aminotransferase
MSKLIFPYAVNSSQPIRNIKQYTEFGFVENGVEYLDLSLGNCGCFPLGFKRQDIIGRVAEQMSDLPFCSGEFYTTNPSVLELSDRLYDMSGGYRSVFALSGSDAIEGALRLAQLYNGRNKFLGFVKSYHGSTYLSSSVSDATYMTSFYGKDSRCVLSAYTLDNITQDLCAVVIETSSWQNGLYNPGKEFWQSLRQKCTDLDIVLIVDDIAMCGGKTGTFFGWTNVVQPDIFTMGKALTSGYFPLSATMVSDKIFDVVKHVPFCHGFSYSFSLSGIYSTLAYLDLIEKEKLFDNYPTLMTLATDTFDRIKDKYNMITSYNNHGLVFNLTLLSEKPIDASFEQFLYQYGLSAGMWNEGGIGLLIIVPLTASVAWFEELEFKLVQALQHYASIPAITSNI